MLFIIIIIHSLLSPVQAATDRTFGARVSAAAAQDLMASPPLPSLENGSGVTLSPQIGRTSIKADGSGGGDASGSPYNYNSKFSGYSGGLGITVQTATRFGFFGFFTGTTVKGAMEVDSPDGSIKLFFNDVKSKILAGAAGVSYRFLGESNSPLAFGLFAGPGFMRVKSSYVLHTSIDDPSYSQTYVLNPNFNGIYSGLQAKLRLGKFLINPYALYFKDNSDRCRKFEKGTIYGTATSECHNDEMPMSTSFFGYGLFLGYDKFRINIYSKAAGPSDYKDYKVTTFSLSYSFTFLK